MAADPQPAPGIIPFRQRLAASLAWTPASFGLLSSFSVIILLVMIVWWPLVRDYLATANPQHAIWQQMDWLLVGIFAAMSLLIMSGANLKRDAWIIAVSLAGGLAIESWGTRTHLWNYYTFESPPLWILPAWPVASLAIDRLTRLLQHRRRLCRAILAGFPPARLVDPAGQHPHPVLACFPCILWLDAGFCPPHPGPTCYLAGVSGQRAVSDCAQRCRKAVLIFIAGSSLGYFLELWGTTRACWTYYTLQTPPVFAVFAHGLASVAFWRVGTLFKHLLYASHL